MPEKQAIEQPPTTSGIARKSFNEFMFTFATVIYNRLNDHHMVYGQNQLFYFDQTSYGHTPGAQNTIATPPLSIVQEVIEKSGDIRNDWK
ncbi:hypothetical protein CHS0354_003758 [Potamilus streckersoni]|uniref:Uncharacterized protein n=1 Tax=Potamilus streckersoni TaxID=2493646 RepID=A0AAE0SHX4_9BIVA|nr:hypothetical protein CHS0354_003758 [Potamilus streckersoni]